MTPKTLVKNHTSEQWDDVGAAGLPHARIRTSIICSLVSHPNKVTVRLMKTRETHVKSDSVRRRRRPGADALSHLPWSATEGWVARRCVAAYPLGTPAMYWGHTRAARPPGPSPASHRAHHWNRLPPPSSSHSSFSQQPNGARPLCSLSHAAEWIAPAPLRPPATLLAPNFGPWGAFGPFGCERAVDLFNQM